MQRYSLGLKMVNTIISIVIAATSENQRPLDIRRLFRNSERTAITHTSNFSNTIKTQEKGRRNMMEEGEVVFTSQGHNDLHET